MQPIFNAVYYGLFGGANMNGAGTTALVALVLSVIMVFLLLTFFVALHVKRYRHKRVSKAFVAINLFMVAYLFILFAPAITGCEVAGGHARNSCLYSEARTKSSVHACIQLDNSYIEKSRCFDNVAEHIDSCQHISDILTKDYCLKSKAVYGNNREGCEKIQTSLEKDWCYEGIAVKEKDVSLCENINENWPKDSCVIRSVSKTSDVQYCNRIEKIDDRYKCIRKIVEETGDKGLCSQVHNTKDYTHKDYCLF